MGLIHSKDIFEIFVFEREFERKRKKERELRPKKMGSVVIPETDLISDTVQICSSWDLPPLPESHGSWLEAYRQQNNLIEKRCLSFRENIYYWEGKPRANFRIPSEQMFQLKIAMLNVTQLLHAVGATVVSEFIHESSLFPYCEVRFGTGEQIFNIRPQKKASVSISLHNDCIFATKLDCNANDIDDIFTTFFKKAANRCAQGKKTREVITKHFPHWKLQAYDYSLGCYESSKERFYLETNSKGRISIQHQEIKHFACLNDALEFLRSLD